ncbi:MAG: insulinase family protein, partial [Myxococcota bacterium]
MSARVAGAFALAFAWVATATSQGAPRRVETLASGLRVIVDPTAGALELALCARVRAGWSQDPPGYEGLAELTRRLLEGPTAHAPEGTALVLASRGVRQTRSDTRADATTWCSSGPPEALPAILWAERERLAFFRSGLRENDVARARQRFLERLELRQGALGAALFGARDRALFGAAHPYARGVGPRPATLRRLGRDAVLRFHQDHYRPADVILALSGAVPEDARGQLRRVLGPLRAHEAPAPAPETPAPPRLGRRGPLLLAWPADVEVR